MFPSPTDKNPKRVEEFIKQVLVDKVFYSETPEENKPTEEAKPAVISARSILQKQQSARSLNADDSWKAFSDSGNKPTTTGHSGGATGGDNWAEFPAVAVAKTQTQPFDPFASGSPVHASPKSIHSMAATADPFAASQQQQPKAQQPQAQAPVWEAFSEDTSEIVRQPPPQQVQTGWSQFETKPVDATTMGRAGSIEKPAEAHTPANGTAKSKAPVMDPLPEEWFSVGTSPSPPPQPHPTGGFAQPDSHVYQPVQQPPFAGVSAFGGGAFQQGAFQPTTPQPYGFNSQAARASLGAFSSFRSNAPPPQWAPQQGFAYMQKQDSMVSHVSQRVDETSHNPLFQNLDMDMRAKAHSVTGVPIQTTPHALFQNPAVNNTSLTRPGTASFQQPFMQTPPQTGFDESSGNPFA